ncbi:MAG TPA: hypothetical protein VER55_00040, partial [Ardenticatenaceae bacterium]|nr:hypothetical protein [Ardenticatenaceae bacterium]
PDTAGDGIPDGVEVAGFSYDGKNWYLDPIETDTNVDGIFDGADCLYEPGAGGGLSCPDTDGDGSPDAFDADDDADGVPDKVDGARTAVVGDPSTGISGGRFGFALTDLTDDKPLYVDFQLRPTNATHLWYSQNVLDWPANDRQGQIQRVHKSTFGSSGELADGDMRLVPMLEIEIPYEDGRYGNLPTIDSAPVITPATPFSQWLDQDEMSSFGVNVRFKDESGTLLAYVPLTLIREEENNSPVAFGGRMFYQPGMDTWGALHQARLIWLVELKTDSCTDTPADYETGLSEDDRRLKWCEDAANWQEDGSRVVHIYDDPWYLTGFSVREDHGALAAVAFQDPAFSAAQDGYSASGFNDDWTWTLAKGLERSWLAGAKDGLGNRALTVNDIAGRWDRRQNTGASAADRWNIPQNALIVERVPGTGVFEHQAQLATIPTSHTKRLLDTYFGPQVDSGITDPTLLFMREEYFRSLTAEANSAQVTPANGATWVNGELQGNGLTLEMEDEAAPFTAVAAMNWAPFRYAGAGVWQSYPIQSYWQDKGVDMKALLDDRWPDADEATMATVIAQSYYLTLFRGVDSLVELGGEPSNLQSQLTDGAMPGYLFGDETVRLGLSLMNTVLTFDTIMRFTQMQWADLIVTVSNRIAPLEFMIRRQINPQIEQKDLFFYFNPNKRIKYAAEEFFKTTTAVALKRARVANFVDEDGRTVKLHNSGRSVRAIKVASAVAPGGVLDKGTTALATVAAVGQIIATASGDIEKPNVALAFAVINTTLATLSAVTVVSSVYISAAATGKSIGFVVQRSLTAIPKNGINGFGASFAIILTAAISVGLFVYQVTAMRLQPNSLPFNLAIAGLVSSLVVAVLFIAIGSVPLFGQLITAVIALIDAVINLICVATGAATGGAGTFVRDYLCGGISGALAKLIQWIIYDQTPLIQLERADRLNLTNFDLSVVDPEKGMQQGNSLRVALDVDTALYKDPLDIDDASIQFPWRLQIEDPNNLKASTFVYALQQGTPQDIHEGLPIGSMRARWQAPTPGGWAAGSNYVTRTPVS